MHRDDSIERLRIESFVQHLAQGRFAAGVRPQPGDTEHGAAALAAADGDARDRADHVLETRHGFFRPVGRVGKPRAIGRAIQHLYRRRRVEAEIFRAAPMRDIAAGFDEALDCDALFEMLTIVPAVEILVVGRVDIHRRQQHALSGERHSLMSSYLVTFEAMSAIAFITAFLTPGSYSEWPASSTMRMSASLQRAASACEVEGGQSRSKRPCTMMPGMPLSFAASSRSWLGFMKQSLAK